MKATNTYINLEGWLDESMQFEPVRQEESRFLLVEQHQRDTGGVIAELRDRAGSLLLARGCEHRFPKGCGPRPLQATIGWLRLSMPRHHAATEIVLLHDGRVIFSAKIGDEPPTVNVVLIASAEKHTLRFRHSALDSAASLVFAVVDESGHAYAAQVQSKDDTHTVSLTPFAGFGKCRLCVQATRDLRTAQALSEQFETPEGRVVGRIISPRDGAALAPGKALSLIGNLSIAQNGRAVQWNPQLVHWAIDGVACDSTAQCAAVDKLDPGSHVIELRYGVNPAKSAVLHKVTVKVREQSSAEKEYADILQRYDTARA